MADHRPAVPRGVKQRLRAAAGGKCSNPGCPNRRTHIHHIDEWAVYQTHDEGTMVAICPTCHDAVHHGELAIDDETLYRWKELVRSGSQTSDVLFVEPRPEPVLRLGGIRLTGLGGLVVFAPSKKMRLSYSVEDGDIALVSCQLSDRTGEVLLKIKDNRVRLRSDASPFSYARTPGRFTIDGPTAAIMADWQIDGIRAGLRELEDQGSITGPVDFGDGSVPVVDAEVVAPGQVTMRGAFADGDRAIFVRDDCWVIPRSASTSMKVVGEGGTIHWRGPVDLSLFEHGFKIW